MRELTFTLVSDGSSDRALLPILTWLLRCPKLDSRKQNSVLMNSDIGDCGFLI